MTRGEIWWADFGIPYGSEPGFCRPVVIMQNDTFNNSIINTIIVVPLTTNLCLADLQYNVLLKSNDTTLAKDSVALIPQLGVIDKSRLKEKVAKLSYKIMADISKNITKFLELS